MSEASFVVNVSAKLVGGALAPFRAFGNSLDWVSTTVRRTMRSFRDMVIVFYGVRRGFDLLSRTIKATFSEAGGGGPQQLARLSKAFDKFQGDIGRTIQRSHAFQYAMEALIDTFAKGISKESQKKFAKSIDDIVIGALNSAATFQEGWHTAIDEIGGWIDELRLGHDWFFKPDKMATQSIIGGARRIASGFGWQQIPGKLDLDSATRDLKAIQGGATLLNPEESILGPVLRLQGGPAFGGAASRSGAYRSPLRDIVRKLGDRSQTATGEDARSNPFKEFAKAFDQNHLDDFNDALDKSISEIHELGAAWTDVGATFGEEAFTNSIGVTKAFKNIGKNAKKAFLSQMSKEAFSPLTETFNQLANLFAIPFRVLGQVIDKLILRPVVDFVSNVIPGVASKAITELTTVQAAGDAMQAGGVVKTVAAQQTIAQSAAPGAVASGIGTLGYALIFGGLALALILAASSHMFADGGLVMPRPGGVHGILAEAGRPEMVVPLGASGSITQSMGGMGGGINIAVYGDLKSTSSNRRLARNLAKEVHREMTSGRYTGGSRRRV